MKPEFAGRPMEITMLRSLSFIFIACLSLLSGCVRLPDIGVTPLKPKTLNELRGQFLTHKPDLDQFRLRGPYAVSVQEDYEIRLSTTESINSDLILSALAEKAPLVIILHGFDASKEDHTYQAMHLASWGMHALVISLPNNGPWVNNGKTLAKLVAFISHWPEIVDNRIDLSKIILVGHSFGGASVAVALAEGAPAIGGILLDPAAISRELPSYLGKIKKPVMLLRADERVFEARNRDYFYRFVPSGVAEITIKNAGHEDAQFPFQFSLTTDELQLTFVSALTAAAVSLSTTGDFEYAWTSFGGALKKGDFFDANKK